MKSIGVEISDEALARILAMANKSQLSVGEHVGIMVDAFLDDYEDSCVALLRYYDSSKRLSTAELEKALGL